MSLDWVSVAEPLLVSSQSYLIKKNGQNQNVFLWCTSKCLLFQKHANHSAARQARNRNNQRLNINSVEPRYPRKPSGTPFSLHIGVWFQNIYCRFVCILFGNAVFQPYQQRKFYLKCFNVRLDIGRFQGSPTKDSVHFLEFTQWVKFLQMILWCSILLKVAQSCTTRSWQTFLRERKLRFHACFKVANHRSLQVVKYLRCKLYLQANAPKRIAASPFCNYYCQLSIIL